MDRIDGICAIQILLQKRQQSTAPTSISFAIRTRVSFTRKSLFHRTGTTDAKNLDNDKERANLLTSTNRSVKSASCEVITMCHLSIISHPAYEISGLFRYSLPTTHSQDPFPFNILKGYVYFFFPLCIRVRDMRSVPEAGR